MSISKTLSTTSEKLGDRGKHVLAAQASSLAVEAGKFESWDSERVKKYWDSMGGSVTKCIKKIGDHVTNPGAFCSALADRVRGKTGWRKGK